MNTNPKNLFTILCIVLCCFFSTTIYAKDYNILDFGAKGDGTTINTTAIQNAIDACNKTGGAIIFPSGKYLTGTLYFKSNVSLILQKGAVLLGSTDLKDYPENLPNYQFMRKGKIKRALIYAENCVNISIKGEGTINGQGATFKEPTEKNISSYSIRPHVIWMIQSKKIEISGIKLQNSALWMQHYIACEKLYIHNIEVYNHANKNNDMMDINGCKDVIISDCIVRPSADKDPIYGEPAGISGLALEVVDGAEMNGISISNIIIDGPQVPIFIRLGNRARGYDKTLPKPKVGSIENITISNITAFNADATSSSITGIPGHPVKNISLDNIRIHYKGGGTIEDANRKIPEEESGYPDAIMFDRLASYGLFIRHAENITLNNVEFYFEKEDQRPALYVEGVYQSKILNLQADVSKNNTLIKLNNSSDLYISNPLSNNKCESSIVVSGKKSKSIRLSDIDANRFDKLFTTSKEVDKSTVKLGTVFK